MQTLDIRGQSWGGTDGRIERRTDPFKDKAEKGREMNVLEGNSSRVNLPPYQRESDGTREPVSRNLWNRFVPVADVVGRHPRASSTAALSFYNYADPQSEPCSKSKFCRHTEKRRINIAESSLS